jgi:hypothetical protein
MSEKKVPLIFNFKGILFSDIFGTSKDEGAQAFPPFFHSPHLKQYDLGEMIQFLSIRGRRLHLCTIV